MKKLRVFGMACVATGLLAASTGMAQESRVTTSPATPAELIATYDSLATAILAVKNTEQNLVHSILSTSYAHANAAVARAQQALQSGDVAAARKALEELAAHVAQIGTEGDNAVAGIRKRLVEGGHHHNASGESQGVFDPGFVVVTKDAKRQLLECSRQIAQLAGSPTPQAVTENWLKVQKVWSELVEEK